MVGGHILLNVQHRLLLYIHDIPAEYYSVCNSYEFHPECIFSRLFYVLSHRRTTQE